MEKFGLLLYFRNLVLTKHLHYLLQLFWTMTRLYWTFQEALLVLHKVVSPCPLFIYSYYLWDNISINFNNCFSIKLIVLLRFCINKVERGDWPWFLESQYSGPLLIQSELNWKFNYLDIILENRLIKMLFLYLTYSIHVYRQFANLEQYTWERWCPD
jgi:hypothetical protein